MKKVLRVEISFKWFDFWIGLYFDKRSHSLYICLLPMLPIRIWFGEEYVCPVFGCGANMHKVAYLDDGWDLSLECLRCGHVESLDWPYGNSIVYQWQLENDGFNVV